MKRRRNLRRLRACGRPHLRTLVVAVVAALGVAGLAPAVPIVIRAVIDRAIAGHDAGLLWWLLALLVALGITKAVCFGIRRQLAGVVSVAVEADLREQLYEHVQALDTGYHERMSTGQLMSRGSSDLQAVRQYFMQLPWSITLRVQVLAVVCVLFVFDAPLAAVTLATVPFLAASTWRFVTRFDPVVLRLQQKLAELASVVEETVTGIRVVKAFGREDHQVAKLEREAAEIYEQAVQSVGLRGRFASAMQALPQVSVVAVLWYGGRRVLGGQITIGTLVAFNAYLAMLVFPVRALGMIVAASQRAESASARIFEVLDTEPGIADRPGATKLVIERGDVRVDNVRFAYPGGRPVLDGVELEIPAGTSLALVGPTGCGKSTLLRLLPRFIEPVSGRVTIDGIDISTVKLRSLRSQMGIVFEDTFLFSDTVRANIAFGKPDAALDDVVRAAVVAQAHEFIEDLPDQYESVIGEQGYTLSGGQRQRIAIARAVLMGPKLLLLDDATSSVDARVEAAIREGLQTAMKDRATLIVARRPSTAALADRVAYMEAGRIVAAGTHEELWQQRPAYREALTAQVTVDGLVEEAAS
jgi:ATP-binding cassette subfamily B protein